MLRGEVFDVIIVGSGAAGVSCAYPLITAGHRVLMLDGGKLPTSAVPDVPFMEYRRSHHDQGSVLFGADYGVAATVAAESPKLRVPSLRYVFDGFSQAAGLRTNGFTHAGSLAIGGMTNAWGGGVSCFTDADLTDWPIGRADLEPSYRAVISRIGVSGRSDDALREFFAWNEDLQEPPPLGDAAALLLTRYQQHRDRLRSHRFRVGHARNAILTEDRTDRRACDRSGWCLWGCPRGSIYSARHDLASLAKHSHFTHAPGRVAQHVTRDGGMWVVNGHSSPSDTFAFRARHVVLACGPIFTARLVLDALHLTEREIQFCSSPSAAFAVILPRMLGHPIQDRIFGSAQLSFALSIAGLDGDVFGNLFSPACLPISEFLARSPLPPRSSIAFFRTAMSALLVGNIFMPGALSNHRLTLRSDGGIDIRWGYGPELNHSLLRSVRTGLAQSMRACGAYLLPGGFKPSEPGSDMHYSSTVPMRTDPLAHQATRNGEVMGLPGVFVVDGSALPSLPAKAHTLTIMANADRIARIISCRLWQD